MQVRNIIETFKPITFKLLGIMRHSEEKNYASQEKGSNT